MTGGKDMPDTSGQDDPRTAIGERIRTRREAAGLTRAQVAARMRARGHGWIPATVEAASRGIRFLTDREATDLAAILGAGPDEFVAPCPDPDGFLAEQAIDDMESTRGMLVDDLDRYRRHRETAIATSRHDQGPEADRLRPRVRIIDTKVRRALLRHLMSDCRRGIAPSLLHEVPDILDELRAINDAWDAPLRDREAVSRFLNHADQWHDPREPQPAPKPTHGQVRP